MRARNPSFALVVVAGCAVLGFAAARLRAEPAPREWMEARLSLPLRSVLERERTAHDSATMARRLDPAREPDRSAGPAFVIEAGERPIGEWTVRCRTGAVRVRAAQRPDVTIVRPSERTAEGAACDDRDSPVAAVRQLFAAYTLRDPELCVESLADDFLFTSDDADFVAAWPHGMTRTDERNFVTKIAFGGTSSSGVALPPVVRMRVRIASFEIEPASADADHARVIARGVECEMFTAAGPLAIEAGDQTFELVRTGDASESPLAGLFSSGAWRIRAWREIVARAAAPAEVAARTDTAPAPAAGANRESSSVGERIRFGIRRLSALRAWPVQLAIAMPQAGTARFELFDVAGRLRMDRAMEAAGPGELSLTIADRDVRAGCYFARVKSGNEVVTTRVIVLR